MPAEPIRFYHRQTGRLETERIYGEGWLRWAYEAPLGRLTTALLIKRAVFSHWYGWRMSRAFSAQRVLPFIVEYDLDVDEFARPPLEYATFNDFFARALKKEARPIAAGDDVAVLPADGRHLAFADVTAAQGFYVKGQRLDLAALLGDAELARAFTGGALVISRLCPVDYHRFHFPVAGTPGAALLRKGSLYSVSPVALRRHLEYLTHNKRMLTLLATSRFGRVAMIEVGATCVGTIRQTYAVDHPVSKGEEKGLFRFGGSCVITLFEPGRLRVDADLLAHTAEGLETYARMGERLGVATR